MGSKKAKPNEISDPPLVQHSPSTLLDSLMGQRSFYTEQLKKIDAQLSVYHKDPAMHEALFNAGRF